MNIKATKIKYKKVKEIKDRGRSLYGRLLEFIFSNHNEPEIIPSSRIVKYVKFNGEKVQSHADEIEVGDFLIEFL